jgi:hypothetical protein
LRIVYEIRWALTIAIYFYEIRWAMAPNFDHFQALYLPRSKGPCMEACVWPLCEHLFVSHKSVEKQKGRCPPRWNSSLLSTHTRYSAVIFLEGGLLLHPSKSIQICQIESFLQSKLKRALPHWYLVFGIWQVRFFCRLVLSVSSEILLHLPFGYMWSIYIRHRASQWGTCGLFFTLLCSITPMLGFKNLLKNPLPTG